MQKNDQMLSALQETPEISDREFVVEAAEYLSAEAQEMCSEVLAEYDRRYGNDEDEENAETTAISGDEFAGGQGRFVIIYGPGRQPLGCGGWKYISNEVAELKRIYVRIEGRGQGLSKLIMDDLERSAQESGVKQLVLYTGDRQPEAISLYRKRGYTDVERFGPYKDYSGVECLGKIFS